MNERAERIKDAARKIAGCDITIRIHEVEPMLTAGWNSIPIGSVVWANCLHIPDAIRLYRKTATAEITAEGKGGQILKVAPIPEGENGEKVKAEMLDHYITRSIIGAKR